MYKANNMHPTRPNRTNRRARQPHSPFSLLLACLLCVSTLANAATVAPPPVATPPLPSASATAIAPIAPITATTPAPFVPSKPGLTIDELAQRQAQALRKAAEDKINPPPPPLAAPAAATMPGVSPIPAPITGSVVPALTTFPPEGAAIPVIPRSSLSKSGSRPDAKSALKPVPPRLSAIIGFAGRERVAFRMGDSTVVLGPGEAIGHWVLESVQTGRVTMRDRNPPLVGKPVGKGKESSPATPALPPLRSLSIGESL